MTAARCNTKKLPTHDIFQLSLWIDCARCGGGGGAIIREVAALFELGTCITLCTLNRKPDSMYNYSNCHLNTSRAVLQHANQPSVDRLTLYFLALKS